MDKQERLRLLGLDEAALAPADAHPNERQDEPALEQLSEDGGGTRPDSSAAVTVHNKAALEFLFGGDDDVGLGADSVDVPRTNLKTSLPPRALNIF